MVIGSCLPEKSRCRNKPTVPEVKSRVHWAVNEPVVHLFTVIQLQTCKWPCVNTFTEWFSVRSLITAHLPPSVSAWISVECTTGCIYSNNPSQRSVCVAFVTATSITIVDTDQLSLLDKWRTIAISTALALSLSGQYVTSVGHALYRSWE